MKRKKSGITVAHSSYALADCQPGDRHRGHTGTRLHFSLSRIKDKQSPPSVVGAAGLITDNGSRGFGLGADLFLKEEVSNSSPFMSHGNVDYDLYGVGYANGNSQLKLPLEQTGQLFFVEFLRNIGWKVFLGPRFVTGNSLITVKPASGEVPPIPPDTGLPTNLLSIGVEALRDSRPNRFYPTAGMLLDFTGDFFSQGLGSK